MASQESRKSMTLKVVIFSHERPADLLNSVTHWRQLMPEFPLVVVDDRSKSLTMKRLLKRLATNGIEVWQRNERGASQLGGLYRNMEWAYKRLWSEGWRFVIFSQDDIQPVRTVDSYEVARWLEYMCAHSDVWQIDLRFSRKPFDESVTDIGWEVDREHRVAVPSLDHPYAHFADVGLVDLSKLVDLDWHFLDSEVENNTHAKQCGLRRVVALDPVVMHTPWPRIRRRGWKGHVVRFIELIMGAGTHPFEPMSSTEISILRQREPTMLASGNVWLKTKDPNVRRPYHYGGAHIPLIKRLQAVGLWPR